MPETDDTGAMPMTEPHMAPIFDTGPHPLPLPPDADEDPSPEPGGADEPELPARPDNDKPKPSSGPPAKPVVVAGELRSVKWWQLTLVLAGVWIPAAGIGLGLFSWWYSLADKTPAVFAVLVYATVCMVAGLIVAMVSEKPVGSALAIALLSAVFAAAVAAAPLYGHYYCQQVNRCVAGVLPY